MSRQRGHAIEIPETVSRGAISADAIASLAALLNVDAPSSVPLGWHFVLSPDRPLSSMLGNDGHPIATGIPGMEGLRRMFAGGRAKIVSPLYVDDEVTIRTRFSPPVQKRGRSGELWFITLDRTMERDSVILLEEHQNLVYRAPIAGVIPPELVSAGAQDPQEGEVLVPTDPVTLFRFSAATFNSHRIHYDRDYAHDVEGYPGLVVHGPLQAVWMAEQARARFPERLFDLFEYRFLHPLFDHQDAFVGARTKADHSVVTHVRRANGLITATGAMTEI